MQKGYKMTLISQLFYDIYDAEYAALEEDEEYQAAKTARAEAEKELVFAMTRKQRRMFHDYAEKARQVDALELRRLFSRCTLLLEVKRRPRVSRETSVSL